MGMDGLESKINLFRSVSDFSVSDYDNINSFGSLLIPHIPQITEQFYERLAAEPETAQYIEGRVEELKRTHIKWLEDLFSGNLDEVFVESQLRIGRAHVEAKVPPLFVAASLSYMRSVFPLIIERQIYGSVNGVGALAGTVLKILDLCQFLIDYAYEQDRFDRITRATGLSLPLLENLIALKPRTSAGKTSGDLPSVPVRQEPLSGTSATSLT